MFYPFFSFMALPFELFVLDMAAMTSPRPEKPAREIPGHRQDARDQRFKVDEQVKAPS